MNEAERLSRDRFCEIFALIHEEQNDTELAIVYKKSVATIRNWRTGAAAPSKNERSEILRECKIRTDLECVAEDEWEETCDEICRSRRVSKKKLGIPQWYYEGGEIEVIECDVNEGIRHVYVVTDDAHNDTHVKDIMTAVEQNVARGVHYTYITTSRCSNIDALYETAQSVLRNCPGTSCGSIEVAVIDMDVARPEWLLIDHLMLMMSEQYSYTDFPNANLDITRIVGSYEQIYKLNEQVMDGTGWIRLSVRKQRAILSLLRSWHAGAIIKTYRS